MFVKAKTQSDAAVNARFIVVEEIDKFAQPFTEGELKINCMVKVCDVVCPDKMQ